MGFKEDFAKMMKRAAGREDELIRSTALGLGAAIVAKSPVDTGRFRGNWQYGVSGINFATNSAEDKTGASAIGRIATGVSTFQRGSKFYITNSLPYAKRLEYDAWSNQATAGMVRISVMEFRANVKRIAKTL